MRLRWNKGKPLVLNTERFVLKSVSRRWIARHTHAWTDNQQVMNGLELAAGGWLLRRWRRQFKVADNRNQFCMAIHEKQNNRLIGYDTISVSGRVAFLSVVIGDTDWWGKGVVVETRRAIIDHLFTDGNCVKVWGTPYSRNFASVFNYQKLGFTQEGVFRMHGRSLQGTASDMIIFAMLADEWRDKSTETRP